MTIVLDGSSGITAPGGTAAAPSITTTGDVNTGIFFPAANTIAASTDGTERLRLDSSGNLGIGTNSPAFRLHVSGSSSQFALISTTDTTSTTGVLFGDSASNTVGRIEYVHSTNGMAFFTNGTTQATLDSSGNLGIGTTSPGAMLDVAGNARSNAWIGRANGSAPTADAAIYRAADNTLGFSTANTERARIDSSGNLGLGVTPSAWATLVPAFQLGGGGTFLAARSTSPEMYLGTNAHYDGTNWKYKTSAVASLYAQDTGEHKWYRAASGTAGNTVTFTQAMTLNTSGNFGIGTSSPATKFVVSNGGALGIEIDPASGLLQSYNRSTSAYGSFICDGSLFQWRPSGTEAMRLDASGNLLVGTTSNLAVTPRVAIVNANFALAINTTNGGSNEAIRFYNAGSVAGTISTTSSTTAYNTSSDYRLKNTIAPITGALAKVALLKPCTYKWNADGSDGQGFIAHELAEVVPDCVTGEKDAVDVEGNPRYQGVDTSFLVATLTAAIQELTARVAALEGNN